MSAADAAPTVNTAATPSAANQRTSKLCFMRPTRSPRRPARTERIAVRPGPAHLRSFRLHQLDNHFFKLIGRTRDTLQPLLGSARYDPDHRRASVDLGQDRRTRISEVREAPIAECAVVRAFAHAAFAHDRRQISALFSVSDDRSRTRTRSEEQTDE